MQSCSKWSRPRPELEENRLADDRRLYIAELQRYLRAVPTPEGDVRLIAVDGIFGQQTRQELAEFQRDFGLPVTGEADYRTWELLFDEYERAQTNGGGAQYGEAMSEGSSGADVLALQAVINQLADRFANLTPVPLSGDYDSATAMATAQLQTILQLPASGIADSVTVESIARLPDV